MSDNEEYVPTIAQMMPSAAVIELKTTCVLVAFFPMIFRKHKAGNITATNIQRTEPIKAITRPKKGIEKATHTEDATSAVRRRK